MVLEMDQAQRRDIDDALERVSLGIDVENTADNPYCFEPTTFTGNNWFKQGNNIVKLNVTEQDSLVFLSAPLTNLVYKNITNVIVEFDYVISNVSGNYPILSNLSLTCMDMTNYFLVENILTTQGHINIECSLFNFSNNVVNTAISEQGFKVGLNFVGNKSNATVKLSNVVIKFEYDNVFQAQSDAVVNRVNFQTDFYNDDESVVLKVGEVEYPIKLQDMFGSAFYDYNLYTSNYSPKINTTITVTCQVKNIFGNPVPNKKLTLYYKGVAQDQVTTNANGIAEWNINVGETDGTFKISVNNRYLFINVIYDTGWVLGSTFMNSHMPSYDSTTTIRVRRIGNIVHFEGIATNENALGGDASGTKIGTLPSEFRPSKAQRFVQQGSGMNRYLLVFQTSGDIYLQRYGTTSMITVPINSWLNMYATWMIK